MGCKGPNVSSVSTIEANVRFRWAWRSLAAAATKQCPRVALAGTDSREGTERRERNHCSGPGTPRARGTWATCPQATSAAARRFAFHAPNNTSSPGMMIAAQMILSRFSFTQGMLPKR